MESPFHQGDINQGDRQNLPVSSIVQRLRGGPTERWQAAGSGRRLTSRKPAFSLRPACRPSGLPATPTAQREEIAKPRIGVSAADHRAPVGAGLPASRVARLGASRPDASALGVAAFSVAPRHTRENLTLRDHPRIEGGLQILRDGRRCDHERHCKDEGLPHCFPPISDRIGSAALRACPKRTFHLRLQPDSGLGLIDHLRQTFPEAATGRKLTLT